MSKIPTFTVPDFQSTDLQTSKSSFSSKRIVFGMNCCKQIVDFSRKLPFSSPGGGALSEKKTLSIHENHDNSIKFV
jgi:hypothetical protein